MSISISKQINPDNFTERKKDNETFYYEASSFKFLDDHYGFRPGKVHMFVGPTGGGKSSLVRTIANKMCRRHKILLLATEEDAADLETTMAYAKEKINHDNFFIVEENGILEITKNNLKDYNGYVRQLEWELEIHKPDLFIFDNLTTSKMYAENDDCLSFFTAIKKLLKDKGIPFIVVAHTASRVHNGDFFEATDIRGNRFCAINSEYLYCLYRFVDECDGHITYANFVYVGKARTHDNINTPYRVWFDKETKQYISDEKYTHESFKKYKDSARKKK